MKAITTRYQIWEYIPHLAEWLYCSSPTESEEDARRDLEEMRATYPKARFRLVEVKTVVTVLEGPGED